MTEKPWRPGERAAGDPPVSQEIFNLADIVYQEMRCAALGLPRPAGDPK